MRNFTYPFVGGNEPSTFIPQSVNSHERSIECIFSSGKFIIGLYFMKFLYVGLSIILKCRPLNAKALAFFILKGVEGCLLLNIFFFFPITKGMPYPRSSTIGVIQPIHAWLYMQDFFIVPTRSV